MRWPSLRTSPEIQKLWLRPVDAINVHSSLLPEAAALPWHTTAWGCKPSEWQLSPSSVLTEQKALLQLFCPIHFVSFVLSFQMDVVLQLDLHYTQLSTKQRTCESLQKILPKLLLGQFFTRRNYTRPSYDSTPARTDPSGALRTGTSRSLPSSNPSKSSSEPEENDERSMSELCSALLRAGPGQEHP